MERLSLLLVICSILFLAGCSEDDDSPTGPGRQFEGITERNEFGDTLSVDSDDWVIQGLVPPQSSGSVRMPWFRDGKVVPGRDVALASDDYSIGAFPNPFIPGTGRLLIELVIPEETLVEIHIEDESGNVNITLWNSNLMGAGILSWNGTDGDGNVLPDGNYRVYFEAGLVHSYGDVMIENALQPPPPSNEEYVIYAQQHFDYNEYVEYEYEVATTFGWDGVLGGDVYDLPISTWQGLNYTERFSELPVFMNYDLTAADPFQYHYLLAYKHFQFGAGWPDDGDIGIVDTTRAYWQKTNSYHNTYVILYEFGP
jgi:hypothetical protein